MNEFKGIFRVAEMAFDRVFPGHDVRKVLFDMQTQMGIAIKHPRSGKWNAVRLKESDDEAHVSDAIRFMREYLAGEGQDGVTPGDTVEGVEYRPKAN